MVSLTSCLTSAACTKESTSNNLQLALALLSPTGNRRRSSGLDVNPACCCLSRSFVMLLGSCPYQDRQEGLSSAHREIVSLQPRWSSPRVVATLIPILPSSYPRLTLDFHTNKRTIDEVVRQDRFLHELDASIPNLGGYIGQRPHQALAQQDRRIHHALDEAYSEGSGARHLLQAPRGGEGAKGQLRAGDLGHRLQRRH